MRGVYLIAAMTLVLLLTGVPVYAAPPDSSGAAMPEEMAVQDNPAQGPVAQFGDRGENVVRVQKLLARIGFYPGELDGIFGKVTLRAVKDFQAFNKLTAVDGIVGKDTLLAMERSASDPSRYSRSLVMTATAYTAQDDGCGATTSRGHLVRKGLVAVDPRVIPLGTRLYIPGYGYAIADDVGGAIKGNRIDLAFENRGEAFQFGVRKVTVYIVD